MTPLTRPATAGDLTAVLSLLGELAPDDPPMAPAEAARAWAEIARQRGRTLLVCEVEGRVAGTVDCLVMTRLPREARPVMFVENLVVARAHRRTGMGRLLMRRAERLALGAGCHRLQLLAAPDPRVHAFYRSCGFSPCPDGFRKYVGADR